MIRPSKRFLNSALILAALAIIITIIRIALHQMESDSSIALTMGNVWWLLFVGLLITAIIDAGRYGYLRQLSGKRALPHSLALNRQYSVEFSIHNQSDTPLALQFVDMLPQGLSCSPFPIDTRLEANKALKIAYEITPKQRGDMQLHPAKLLVNSRWGLWVFTRRIGDSETIKVYPDFSIVNSSSLMSIENTINFSGEHLSQKRGDGMEFNQLREFGIGDTLSQIDWKATARMEKPISREYQEEKDQNLIFLLDCSRRMRAKEDNLSYFDHALNALLINSYIALNKGDAVGVMTFAGEKRWLSPIKGKSSINRLLNHLYSVETSTASSDYIEAAEALLSQHRKRSLIVFITNLYEEDHEDIIAASQLLAKHHLVMVAALQERLLSEIYQQPINDVDSALLYSGVTVFSQHRQNTLSRLKASGVVVVDANHRNLHNKLLHEYLQLKRIGRI